MKFYTVSGTAPEYFYSTTVDQAVTDYLDNTPVGDWPATVEVEEWKHIEDKVWRCDRTGLVKTVDVVEFNENKTPL